MADVLKLPRVTSPDAAAAALAALDGRDAPRLRATRDLLAAVALYADDVIDGFVGVDDDRLLLLGPDGHMISRAFVDALGDVDPHVLGADLGLSEADFAAHVDAGEAIPDYLAGLLEAILRQADLHGWLRAPSR